ncbi:MAG: hypothetical protein E7583_05820, partial [Ruminococcaceae bacterium]|nr:hypothetical protein [Oscillospiraceae bacterium]
MNMYLYFIFTVGLPLILTLTLTFLSPVFLVSFFPLWETFEGIFNLIASCFSKDSPPPCIKLDEIPDNNSVLAVIPVLLKSEAENNAVFDNLEHIYLANRGRNIKFGVLADLCDSKTATVYTDESILDHAHGRIHALCTKYGDDFVLFERPRSYSKSEESFIGRNRKLGAVCEVVSFLRGNDTVFSEKSVNLAQRVLSKDKIKYLVLFNSDSDPGLWAVRDLCSVIMHPKSKPHIEKDIGIVTKGYGVIGRKYDTLHPQGKTFFSRTVCHNDNFIENAALFVYSNIFERDIFRGEGIIDVDAFYDVIVKPNAFPDDSILSQDILIGMKLGCKYARSSSQKKELADDQQSYLMRLHDRIRGDVRNLAFLFSGMHFSKNSKRQNNIDTISGYILFNRVRSEVVPVFAMLGVFISVFTAGYIRYILISASLCYLVVPLICTLTYCDRPGDILRSFAGILLSLSMLPVSAFCASDAVIKGLYRSIISKKKLLERQASYSQDTCRSGLLIYVYKNIFAVFSGFLLFVIAPFGVLSTIAMLWFVFPVIAYHSSLIPVQKEANDKKQSSGSPKAAREIWKSFADNVTDRDNFLPRDDIWHETAGNTAKMTSPQSIGLYLLSLLCARDNNLITTAELEKRTALTLKSIERLPRFKGHLYSKYDTEKLVAIPPYYVSSADNGFISACIVTLVRGLTEYVCESTSILDLTKMLSALDFSMDHAFLYDRGCDLFYKGAFIRNGGVFCTSKEHLDTPTAKAITLGYIQCARRNVPKEHLDKLFCGGDARCNSLPHMFLPIYTYLPHSEDNDDIGIKRFISAFGDSMSRRFMGDGVMNCANGLIRTINNNN